MGNYKKPTKAMIRFFKKRTEDHINRVIRFMKMLECFADFSAEELIKRGLLHDQDKYSDPKLVLSYVWVTEYHRVNNEEGGVSSELQEMYDLASEATKKHTEQNLHHPEAHTQIELMSPLDLAEMVCDWFAMAEELGEGSARSWADNNVGSKWEFSPDQIEFIYEIIDWLEDKAGVKERVGESVAIEEENNFKSARLFVGSAYGLECTDIRTCSEKIPNSWKKEDLLQIFDDVMDIQCSDGNRNVDPYMHGLANGMILMRSFVSGEEPLFLEAPNVWLNDDANECSAGFQGGVRLVQSIIGDGYTDQLNRMAFGVTEGVQQLPVDQIQVHNQDDYEEALYDVEECPTCYEEALENEPVLVVLERGVYWLEDGHHRFVIAERRGDRNILADLTIKDNPTETLMQYTAINVSPNMEDLEYRVDDSIGTIREIASTLRQKHGRKVDVPTRPDWVPTSDLWDEYVEAQAHRSENNSVEAAELAIAKGQALPPVVLYDGVIESGYAYIAAAHNLGVELIPVIESF